ncbi:MAG: hypothetical protein RID53_29590 [Coleofasciculus sp. B1-GNL1-01]|uniref:hypothetical protein n=1 Tax=Coleofasciculus sp. B1-GNL1-01 TaxID=3068484 RepID=UPI0033054553
MQLKALIAKGLGVVQEALITCTAWVFIVFLNNCNILEIKLQSQLQTVETLHATSLLKFQFSWNAISR